MTRHLIVNADDFGLTSGINRGIAHAYAEGVVTSTSLMVFEPAAPEAAEMAADLPGLDVGLHVVAPAEDDWPAALDEQLDRFLDLTGRRPTHLDSHHHVHRDPEALPHFQRLAGDLGIPLRGDSPAALLTRFYGRWDDESHPEWLTPKNLLRLLDKAPDTEWLELMCHPGYADADLRSSYSKEREVELATLCDPRLREGLEARGFALARFRDLARAT
jgi:chitin disaccharide deacetylase